MYPLIGGMQIPFKVIPDASWKHSLHKNSGFAKNSFAESFINKTAGEPFFWGESFLSDDYPL